METYLCIFLICTALLFDNVQGQGKGAIRLFNNGKTSASFRSGVVQVYYNKQWINICGSNALYVGDVVCRQLGFSGGSVSSKSYGNDSSPLAIKVSACSGFDLTILQCTHDKSIVQCAPSDDLAVECDATKIWDLYSFSGYVRLTGENRFTGSGRVEVYCNNKWGTICYSGFRTNDADTVCRQLGYNDGTVNQTNTNGSLPVWLNTPSCTSSTDCLSNCESCPLSGESPACTTRNAAAGVTCSYESGSGNGGTNNDCLFADSNTIKNLVAIIVGSIIAFLVCVAVIIAIPFICCCCCCLGIGAGAGAGVGAAASRRPKYDHL